MRITGLLSVLVVYDSDLFAHVQALWNDILSEIKKKDTNTHVRASICCHNIHILGLCGMVISTIRTYTSG